MRAFYLQREKLPPVGRLIFVHALQQLLKQGAGEFTKKGLWLPGMRSLVGHHSIAG
jgi:hypothetical protein